MLQTIIISLALLYIQNTAGWVAFAICLALLFALRLLSVASIKWTQDWPIVDEKAQREWMRQSKAAWPQRIAPP